MSLNINISDINKIYKNGNNKEVNISWQMTYWCNYNCEYCIQKGSKNNGKVFPNMSFLCQQALNINNTIEASDVTRFKLSLIGGEITYIDLKYLFDNYLTSTKITKVHITTNLSRDIDYFIDITNYFNEKNIKVKIVPSLHLTQIKNLDDFINKAKYLKSRVELVVSEYNLSLLENAIVKLLEANLSPYLEIDRLSTNPTYIEEVTNNLILKYNLQKEDKKKAYIIELNNKDKIEVDKNDITRYLHDKAFYNSNIICSTNIRFANNKWLKGVCEQRNVLAEEEDLKSFIHKSQCSDCSKACSFCGVQRMEFKSCD